MRKLLVGLILLTSVSSYAFTVTQQYELEGKVFQRIELSTSTQSTKVELIEKFSNHPDSTVLGFIKSRMIESQVATDSQAKAQKIGYTMLQSVCLNTFNGVIVEGSEKVLETQNTSPIEEVTTLNDGSFQVLISNRADAKVEGICEVGLL